MIAAPRDAGSVGQEDRVLSTTAQTGSHSKRGQGKADGEPNSRSLSPQQGKEDGAEDYTPSPHGRGGEGPRRFQVRLFGQWCKGCGLCIAFCPRSVFAAGADGRPLAVYPERCTACMFCTDHCPDFAIEIRPLPHR